MFCSKCGSPNNDGAAFCAKCGAALGAAAATTPGAAPGATPAPETTTMRGHAAAAPVRSVAGKNPTVALVLSIFLGAFGAGQFYNGDWKKGLAMVAATLVLGLPPAAWSRSASGYGRWSTRTRSPAANGRSGERTRRAAGATSPVSGRRPTSTPTTARRSTCCRTRAASRRSSASATSGASSVCFASSSPAATSRSPPTAFRRSTSCCCAPAAPSTCRSSPSSTSAAAARSTPSPPGRQADRRPHSGAIDLLTRGRAPLRRSPTSSATSRAATSCTTRSPSSCRSSARSSASATFGIGELLGAGLQVALLNWKRNRNSPPIAPACWRRRT